MARHREETRIGLTELAQQQGIEVAPGQLAAVGLADDAERDEAAAPPPVLAAGQGKYFRVVHVTTTIPAEHDQGRPDHVVRAADRANALERFNHEMGILGFSAEHVRRDVSEVTEADYIHAQAKRLRIDLREHRQVPEGQPRAKGFFPLTWQPPGGLAGSYVVNEKGELKPAE